MNSLTDNIIALNQDRSESQQYIQSNQQLRIDLKQICKTSDSSKVKLDTQSSLQYTPQSNLRKHFRDGNFHNLDTQSYISSTTTSATRGFSLQNKLKDITNHAKLQEDYEDGESVCCYYKNTFTDEILDDEVFMPQTRFSNREPHQSKLFWDKENRDQFHKIKNIDTGQEYDIRKKDDFQQITDQVIPSIKIEEPNQWSQWWEKKKENQKEFEKACKLNLTDKIKELVQQTESDLMPNLNAPINEGWTPLHYFAYFGNTPLCNLLIQKDINLDSVNIQGQTPLILACLENKQDVAALLIESGANINAQDQYLNTPLHYCFLNGDKDLLDIILKKPYLDINLRNNNNKLPYQESSNEDLITYFRQQVQKKELQRNIKAHMQIIEYDEEDLHNLFSNNQSIVSNLHSQSILNHTSQYIVHGLIGKGAFAEVFLVEERKTGKQFALKMLHKQKIIEQNMYKYAITERNILQLVDHPFIVKMHKAFQTKDKLFFLLENGKRGDILQHLKFEKKFSESKAQFYAAEVLLALEYLHNHDIIYRDLKAQNILIAEDGHVRITDFGLSKEGVREYDQGARSFCGSVAYMPPEILRNQGHGKSIDLYLLGIFIFEMLTGQPPFYGKDENTIYNNIQMNQLKFPNFISRTAKSLLIKLLSKDPRFRPTPDQIKRHPFFQGIDWKQLAQKNVKPPKSIQLTQQMYTQNEDIFEDREFQVSPTKLNKIKLQFTTQTGQKQELFQKWTFVGNP
ncbi:Serine/Threonine kinase domain protein (macronuclear) [Tetrahymena thermophila SB210]|uniref:Serine/Threonine kinase domain protein n=1 Tax=Tetrahymena thermophila (strain SB210) TaxID=312017 RepID=I7M1N1_TETTS|nr:Serine/Threonine kinase domain protein [Tetrahymena thermophila SB210]EAR97218.2 Serine/Threonine kinase domain protein [Tetrahymena thermophila SB210]|eukprot:XP_001017463.2 Serine/Threonine kinase domain protein [Tetrahymena thermophila SB210]